MQTLTDLLPGFTPESALEEAIADDPDLRAGLAWGEPRKSHPEGTVAAHVHDLLEKIDADRSLSAEDRQALRFIAIVHDAFKYKVHNWLPHAGPNHHATRARRFAERFTDDERLLTTIELHDRPYNVWRKLQRTGKLDERRFGEILERVPDLDLFVRFVDLDGSTEGKRQEPLQWFRDELRRRGRLS